MASPAPSCPRAPPPRRPTSDRRHARGIFPRNGTVTEPAEPEVDRHDRRPARLRRTVEVPRLSDAARATIDTPALVVDLDRTDAAIASMAAAMAERGVALRPHAKTHKSLEIGRRQIAAGAAGTHGRHASARPRSSPPAASTTCSSPIPWSPLGPKADRLRALAARARLRLGVDSSTGARAVADALGRHRDRAQILVEIDTGGRRSGVPPAAAGALAREAADLGLAVVGVFTHGGHGYAGPTERVAAADDEVDGLDRSRRIAPRRTASSRWSSAPARRRRPSAQRAAR